MRKNIKRWRERSRRRGREYGIRGKKIKKKMDKTKDNNKGYCGKRNRKIQKKRRFVLGALGLEGLMYCSM
jgi:hypothetical protein